MNYAKEKPEVSIVIPLYNKEKYICRTLNSVFSQTVKNFEVIVVDDGSTDNGPEKVAEYKDSRLRLVRQRNQGPGAARNRGIKEAGATFLTFIDADDEWLETFLEVSIENLRKYPECVLSTVGFFYDKITGPLGNIMKFGVWQLNQGMNPLEIKSVLDSVHSAGTVMCRRGLILEYGGFYEKRCNYGEDSYLWLKILLNHKIIRDPRPLFIYHTEASEYGSIARRDFYPPKPYLLDPHPIREVCPEIYKDTLEDFLSYWALKYCHRCMDASIEESFTDFEEAFPAMKKWKREYLKLKIKKMFPFYKRMFSE